MIINDKIQTIGDVISQNIERLSDSRGLLSQNILGQLRNLIEAIAVKIYAVDHSIQNINISYNDTITPAINYVKSQGRYRIITQFHKFLQISSSHYTAEPENAERLMLKYYEHLLKLRRFLKDRYNLTILSNLENFPIQQDENIYEYFKLISEKINTIDHIEKDSSFNSRYYVRKVKPFFIDEEIYYEITFMNANDKSNKFDRIIAYSKHDILVNYSIKIDVVRTDIHLKGFLIPALIIKDWAVSIRPCELENLAKIFDENIRVQSSSKDYQSLMNYLTSNYSTLNQLIDLNEYYYNKNINFIFTNSKSKLYLLMDKIYKFLSDNKRGSNVIRYLLNTMRNDIIRKQSRVGRALLDYNSNLSSLRLNNKCIPFEEMPFASSLINHNPSLGTVFSCISSKNRDHEILARVVKNKTEKEGNLFVKISELNFDNIDNLIDIYNSKLYFLHTERQLAVYKEHIYIKSYDNDVKYIIEEILSNSTHGIDNYSNTVIQWLEDNKGVNDSEEKEKALIEMFENSRVSAIYGSAGVGKTTMINLIAQLFPDIKKLFLANTHPAIDNLKRRVKVSNSRFMTIAKYYHSTDIAHDIIFIDESSTVSNSDMKMILSKSKYKLIVLVGDIYQIESITFGNWFQLLKNYLPEQSVVELENPYRTESADLLTLWKKVREIDPTITESLIKYNYVSNLDNTIFEKMHNNEIILCLNYDGLYGINNINRILQNNNPNQPIYWGVNAYKINDPILFNEASERFAPLLYNNLKGTISKIDKFQDKIIFEITLEKAVNELELVNGVTLVGVDENRNSIIRFIVYETRSIDNDENDDLDDVVPFNVSYAISIHKSQGLEFDSVKIVILNEIGELINHNIFYTSITRAKKHLKIYWSPETQNKIIDSLVKIGNKENVHLLSSKHGFKIINK